MTTPLLARHRLVATTDVDEARDQVARRFCAHRLEVTSRAGRLDMVHNSVAIAENVSLNYLRYGSEVRITPGTFDDFYLVQIPLAGTARVKVGHRVVASDRHRASLGSPTEPVDMIWSADCEQFLVYLRRSAVEELAGAPVVFDPLMELDSPSNRAWRRLVHIALDDLETGGAMLSSALAAQHLEQALIAGLLAAQPNSSAVQADARPAHTSRTVRIVTALIDAEPDRPWTLAELARHAAVSTRTLQQAFQQALGVSPLEQVRRTRLERAHRDLIEADPTSTSVTEIAARWGFFHLGRFSQTYRATYQELPSHTLAS